MAKRSKKPSKFEIPEWTLKAREKVQDDLSRFVRCVGVDSPGGWVEAFGSCVPALFARKPYLLTAKHVLDRIGTRRVLLELGDRFQPIGGQLRSADSEELDVSVLELPLVALEWGLDFVDLEREREPVIGPEGVEILVAMGYPIADSELLPATDQLALKRINYWSFESEGAYSAMKRDRLKWIASKYDRKQSFEAGVQRMPKKPHGMSGGAMWRFWGARTEMPTLERFGLAGILVSYHEDSCKCMFAARLGVLQDLAKRLAMHAG